MAGTGLLAGEVVSAQEIAVEVGREAGWVTVAARVRSPDSSEVLASLERGLTAEISYQVRLYEEREGILGLLGDRLVSQNTYTLTAQRDRFEDRFRITSGDGEILTFETEQDFVAAFFGVRDVPLYLLADLGPAGYHIAARFRLQPVRLLPPLDLITLIGSGAITSPWAHAPVPAS